MVYILSGDLDRFALRSASTPDKTLDSSSRASTTPLGFGPYACLLSTATTTRREYAIPGRAQTVRDAQSDPSSSVRTQVFAGVRVFELLVRDPWRTDSTVRTNVARASLGSLRYPATMAPSRVSTTSLAVAWGSATPTAWSSCSMAARNQARWA
jgi:hypothetical protein